MINDTLTVAELAEVIVRQVVGERTAPVIRRLRHWTLAGILKPIGAAHSGSGHHRRYSRDSIPIAAVLNWLANRGLSITMLDAIGKTLPFLSKHQSELWKQATSGRTPRVYLGVLTFKSEEPAQYELPERVELGLIAEENLQEALDVNEGMILINLSVLFRRLPPEE
jgi:DNA-binding transcriptional MerR regulator